MRERQKCCARCSRFSRSDEEFPHQAEPVAQMFSCAALGSRLSFIWNEDSLLQTNLIRPCSRVHAKLCVVSVFQKSRQSVQAKVFDERVSCLPERTNTQSKLVRDLQEAFPQFGLKGVQNCLRSVQTCRRFKGLKIGLLLRNRSSAR